MIVWVGKVEVSGLYVVVETLSFHTFASNPENDSSRRIT